MPYFYKNINSSEEFLLENQPYLDLGLTKNRLLYPNIDSLIPHKNQFNISLS